MKPSIELKEAGFFSKFADWLMVPIMYLLSGTFRESPQRTHFWNNTKYSFIDLISFDTDMMVFSAGNPGACKPWFAFMPIFHMKIFGGWNEFIVLTPVEQHSKWFVGWRSDEVNGVSQIPLNGQVRLLVGNRDVWFFGVNKYGEQIRLTQVGVGLVGKSSTFSSVPLL